MEEIKESPIFRYEFDSIEPGTEVGKDFTDGYNRERDYIPFNYIIINNFSTQRVILIVNDNNEYIIPPSTTYTIEDERLFRFKIKNPNDVATDDKISISLQKTLTVKDLLKLIADRRRLR